MSNNPVYFDLDGCLADFDAHYDRLVGERKPNGDVLWPRVQAVPDFFESMPQMRGAMTLWAAVPPHRRRILSSIPKSIKVSGDQKRAWVKTNLGMDGDGVILVRGKSLKQAYAKPGHILIDDWPQNIDDWRAAGGIGILYVTHEQALGELRAALEVKPERVSVGNTLYGTIGVAVLLIGLYWLWKAL